MFTFSAVSHAALRRLQVVDQEVAAVPHRDGDAEKAAVFGAAMEELPCGAGGELADLAGSRQRGVLQRQPDWSLGTTVVHLQVENREPVIIHKRSLLFPAAGLKVLIKQVC